MHTRDLPDPVRRAVAEGLDAAELREEGLLRAANALAMFTARDWRHAMQLLALSIGYLTAAARREEPD